MILDRACYLTMVSIDKMESAIDKWTNTSPGEKQNTRRNCLPAAFPILILHRMTCDWPCKAV